MTRVAEIMTENPVTVQPSQSIDTAITLMRQGNFRRLPVVENGRLVGIVTDRDMRRATNSPILLHEKWYDNFLLEHIEVGACMTPNPVSYTHLRAHETVLDLVCRLLLEKKTQTTQHTHTTSTSIHV